jgi:triacylglycerol esterase/lipase EstA (alpha/beta hydrolase family)
MHMRLTGLGRLSLVVLILGCLFVAANASVRAAPPTLPQALPPTGNCAFDNIYYGATPRGSEARPVLVFVHGLWGLAEDWWKEKAQTGPDTMYVAAYDAGYRTAFVSMNIDPTTPGDCSVEAMPGFGAVQSGYVLKQQIDVITEYYGVERVELITHSKGAVDAQTAIVRWGASAKVHNVFMLGPPNQGSLLADLLHSPEGEFLHDIAPPDAATYSITTPVMQDFREQIDASTVDDKINYYVGAGNKWQDGGPVFEAFGPYLEAAGGANDGVINVVSTELDGSMALFLKPWNHGELTRGSYAFPYIERALKNPVYLPVITK